MSMDWLREWWGVIVAFLGGGVWIGKLQRDIESLKKDPPVTVTMCNGIRANCKIVNDLQFSYGEKQFSEIKKLIADNNREIAVIDEKNEKRHNDMINILLGLQKQ